MRKFGIVALVSAFFVLFPTFAFAHEGGASGGRAPDLHPLIVLLEFVVVLWLGYKIAGWLAGIGRGK